MNAFYFLNQKEIIKPGFPVKKERRITMPELSEKQQAYVSHKTISISVFTSALEHELKALKRLGILKSFPLIKDFQAEMKVLTDYFTTKVLKDEDRKEYYQSRLTAIENIIAYLLASDDELIYRTERFIESKLTKSKN